MRLFQAPPAAPAWTVVDLETTGLHPSTDRVVEIGAVRLDANGHEMAAWTTLVDPQRDIGPTRIHGLTTRALRGAPKFADVANDLLAFMSGSVVVAHNAWFDSSFLNSECRRIGVRWGPITGLCTMATSTTLGVCRSRRLIDACDELGIVLDHHHTALDDARATAALFLHLLPPRYALPAVAPPWPIPKPACSIRLRSDPPLPRTGHLGSLASRIAAPTDELEADPSAVISYLGLLDLVMEDRILTANEVDALATLARDWGISAQVAEQLHAHYLHNLWQLALADGVVTQAERDDIETVAELLGIPLELNIRPAEAHVRPAVAPGPLPRPVEIQNAKSFTGMSVCFTGESVCSIDGEPLDRAQQELLAARSGLIVKSNVSGKLDLLVLADPDSQSGKARKAREMGVRCIAEPVFWRDLGISID
jgi:DNA polymerase III subunit epsilon